MNTKDCYQKEGVLAAIGQYEKALTLLDQYDHQCLEKPKGRIGSYQITEEDVHILIQGMESEFQSDVFGKEKSHGRIEGILSAVFQEVFGTVVYPSLEEKAANLLYLFIKDHPFNDGCKRIAASVFVAYLYENHALYKEDGQKQISDEALAAVTLLIAQSDPEEKDVMIRLLMNFLAIAKEG